jgi:hypothetical protein
VSQERRRYVRLGTEHNIACTIEGVDVVHIVGLGSEGSGMRVITNKELPHEGFAIEMSLDDGGAPIVAKAKVAWQEQWDFDIFQRHVAGLTLEELSEDARTRLNKMLDEAAAAASSNEPPDSL